MRKPRNGMLTRRRPAAASTMVASDQRFISSGTVRSRHTLSRSAGITRRTSIRVMRRSLALRDGLSSNACAQCRVPDSTVRSGSTLTPRCDLDRLVLSLPGGHAAFLPGETIEVDVEWQLDSPAENVELRLIWSTSG